MSARTPIQSILVIVAGPILIGQACEFENSGRLRAFCTYEIFVGGLK